MARGVAATAERLASSPSTWRRRTWFTFALVAVVGTRIAAIAPMKGPVVFQDETAYLFIARYLAGIEPIPSMGISNFHYFGYALVLVPGFLAFDAPIDVYRYGLVVNVVLLSSIFPLSYLLARRLFHVRPQEAAMAAFTAALYPAFALQAGIVWAESLFISLSLVFALAVYWLGSSRSALAASVVSLTAVGLYAVHGRALLLVVWAAAWFGYCSLRRVMRWRVAVAGVAVLTLAFIGTRLGLAHTRAVLWIPGRESFESRTLRLLADPGNWDNAVLEGAGQLWYLVSATLGLFLLGVVQLFRLAWRNERLNLDRPEGFAAATLLPACGAMLFAAATTAMFPKRADQYIHGRYNEGFLAILLVAGCVALVSQRVSRRQAAAGVATLAVLAAAVAVRQELILGRGGIWTGKGIADHVSEGIVLDLNVLGLSPVFRWLGGIRIFATTALIVALMILLVLVRRVSRPLAIWSVTLLFVVGSLFGLLQSTAPLNRGINRKIGLPHEIRRFGRIERLAYDRDGSSFFGFFPYQFYLDETRFELFRSSRQEPPEDIVVSNRTAPALRERGARAAYMEFDTEQALWVMPGPRQEMLARRGLLLPTQFPGPLPEEAYRSRINLREPRPERLSLGASDAVEAELLVTHKGSGSPWPALFTTPEPRGVVRLHATWFDERGGSHPGAVAELPKFVYPGETVPAAIQLSAVLPSGHRLSPGRYRVRIALIQEGFGFFIERGDEGLTLDVMVQR